MTVVKRNAEGKITSEWDDNFPKLKPGQRWYVSDEVKAIAFGDAGISLEPLEDENPEPESKPQEVSTATNRIWERVELEPVAVDVTLEELRELSAADYARTVRDNIIPTQPRKAWDRLWWGIKVDPDLRADTLELLDEWEEQTRADLAGGQLSIEDARQAQGFLRRLDEARARVLKDNLHEALAWAGQAGDFQPQARRVIAILVAAIARHRDSIEDPTDADEQLWHVLQHVDLDPRDYFTPEEARYGVK